MVSSTPAGSGLPMGLIPGALPSDHASRQTLKITAMRFPPGHSQFGLFILLLALPRSVMAVLVTAIHVLQQGKTWVPGTRLAMTSRTRYDSRKATQCFA